MYVEYDLYNKEGKRIIGLLVVNVCLSASRNTLARALTLIVALGYGITIPSI
jgi:hypothetical protein